MFRVKSIATFKSYINPKPCDFTLQQDIYIDREDRIKKT